MRKSLLPITLLLLSTLITGCDLADQIAEGNLSLEIGGIVLLGPGAKPAAASPRVNAAIHSGAPGPAKIAAAPAPAEVIKPRFGSCEKNDHLGIVSSFRKAQAVVKEIWVATASGDRVEKLKVDRKTINLLQLASEVSEMLSGTIIPAGEYKEVQIMLEKAIVTDSTGKVWPLQIPQGEKNGVRIQLERSLNIGGGGDKARVSLTFCTESNFLVEKEGTPQRKLEFHPIIDRVANLSI